MSDCSTILFYCSILWFPKPLSDGDQVLENNYLRVHCSCRGVRRPTFGEQGGEVEVDAGGEVEQVEEERGIVLQFLCKV